MAFEQERKDLATQLWARLSTQDTPRLSNRTLTRIIGVGAKSYNAKVLVFLNTYVDVKNIDDAGNPVARSWVDDPQADQIAYPGRWRLVSNSWNAQLEKYVQVLRFGWAEAYNADEVRYQEIKESDTSETGRASFRTIILPNVAPGSSRTIAAGLLAGDANTDTNRCIEAWATENQEDGSHDVHAVLIDSTEFTSIEKTISDNVFETVKEQSFSNLKPGSVPTPSVNTATGIMVVVQAVVDRFKRWAGSKKTVMSHPSIYSTVAGATGGPIAYSPRAGVTEYFHIAKNQRTLVYPTARAGYTIRPYRPPNQNPDGSWDWHAIEAPDDTLLPDDGMGTISKYTTQLRKQQWSPNGSDNIKPQSDVYWFTSTTRKDYIFKVYTSAAAAWVATYNGIKISNKPEHIGFGRWLVMFEWETTPNWIKTDQLAEKRGGL